MARQTKVAILESRIASQESLIRAQNTNLLRVGAEKHQLIQSNGSLEQRANALVTELRQANEKHQIALDALTKHKERTEALRKEVIGAMTHLQAISEVVVQFGNESSLITVRLAADSLANKLIQTKEAIRIALTAHSA